MAGESSEITQRIVAAVTAETGRDPLELPPLYETIDPDSLETACETFDTGTVTFQYADHLVTVRADRTVDATTNDERVRSATKGRADD